MVLIPAVAYRFYLAVNTHDSLLLLALLTWLNKVVDDSNVCNLLPLE